ncbi:MAG: hypothetical protein DLM68_03690 [Hyphomicrobiales bacterium]|nr:MAG: hypothetical protein DLM68_03690 [Hyphomicrobiales bacterium]
MFHNIDYANRRLGGRSFPIARLQTMPIGVAKQADNCYALYGTGFSAFGTTTVGALMGWHPCGAGPLARAFFGNCADEPVGANGGTRARSTLDMIFWWRRAGTS